MSRVKTTGSSGVALLSMLTIASPTGSEALKSDADLFEGFEPTPVVRHLNPSEIPSIFELQGADGEFYHLTFPALPDVIGSIQPLDLEPQLEVSPLSQEINQPGVEKTRHPEFVVRDEMRERVDFWKSVFTTSGDIEIFHLREYPWLEIERMDFSTARESMSERDYERHRDQVVDRRVEEIHRAVKRLARGREARTELDFRILEVVSEISDREEPLKFVARDLNGIRSQKGISEHIELAIHRSGRYLNLLEQVLVKEHGLPEELCFLPVIESTFDIHAGSSKGAAGMWQFMRGTARKYGLRVDRTVDQRFDPVEATYAAAQYLLDAHAELGSWPLAVTSYNHGVAGIKNAVSKVGSTDILDLIDHASEKQLRRFGFATSNFYPELLAALEIFDEREQHYPETSAAEPLSYETYELTRSHSVFDICSALGIDKETLREYNPALSSRVWEGGRSVPAGYEIKMPQRLPLLALSEMDTAVIPYVVRHGDTLSEIASAHKVRVADLKRWNGLKDDLIFVGQKLNTVEP